jgi:peptide-methionine (S)-S-oxide reductase
LLIGLVSSIRVLEAAADSGRDYLLEAMAQQATFAAGCFWSVELAFQRVPGVTKTNVGYTQGKTKNPTYREVCSGQTGHVEAVQVEFNPAETSYKALLDVFWKKHDPTQKNRQGNDVGSQYRSGIYYHTEEQKEEAIASMKEEEARLGKPIMTEILPATTYYLAEDYHQQYLEKGVSGRKQSAAKMCNDPIRCYG